MKNNSKISIGVNLLPPKEQMNLRVRYYTALASLFVFLLVGVCIVGIALLMPSYFLAESEAGIAVRAMESSAESVKLYQSSGTVQQISLLKERISVLKEYQGDQATALVLSRITAGVADDIHVNAISLVVTSSGVGKVTVSGKANTRLALINFGKKLESERMFEGAVVPVSDLATGVDIDFSIPFTFDVNAP
ncbi:MAG: hypothetical protein V4449_00435 [Patescibacteria group bacterium]